MAEPWIKMRTDLSTNPKVVAIADILGVDEDLIVGKMHRLWSWADKHAKDGRALGNAAYIDRLVNCPGLAAALMRDEIDWLAVEDGTLVFPRWDEHNSQSAKTRALAMRRMKQVRADEALAQQQANGSATPSERRANTSATRGDKRRGEETAPAAAQHPQAAGTGHQASGTGVTEQQQQQQAPSPVLGEVAASAGEGSGPSGSSPPLPYTLERLQPDKFYRFEPSQPGSLDWHQDAPEGQRAVARGDRAPDGVRKPVESSPREAQPPAAADLRHSPVTGGDDIRVELLTAIRALGATGAKVRTLLAAAPPEHWPLIGALVREHKERVKRDTDRGKNPVGVGVLLVEIERLVVHGDPETHKHAGDRLREYRRLDREKAQRIARTQHSMHGARS